MPATAHAPVAPLRRAWVQSLVLALLLAVLPCAVAADLLEGRALGDALRHGGYVLYFRHAATDFGQNDENMTSFDDCTRQRNLTDRGRDDARAIGEALRRARVPVDTVLASPFCRTRETAQLVFGRATVRDEVRGGPASDDASRYAGLRALLQTPVPEGSNVAIVSHGNPFRAVAGPPYLAEGEAAVIEPRGRLGFRVIGRIAVNGWDALGP